MEPFLEIRYRFQHGLPAFEQDREFRLIVEPDWHPFLAMESLRDGGPRFICIEVAAIVPDYFIELCQEDADIVGVTAGRHSAGEGRLRFLGIVNTADDGSLTANLAAPLVLDSTSASGVQSIQPESRYSPFTIILQGQERQAC